LDKTDSREAVVAEGSTLKIIRLNLARSPEHPAGSARHGYRFTAPLDADGHLDPDGWREHRERCRVVRFWGDEEDDIGHLVHHGTGWGFHYDLGGDEGDEAGFKLGSHRFVSGEYVSIRDDDEATHTFQVVTVEDAEA
jgi:hypothetical protein